MARCGWLFIVAVIVLLSGHGARAGALSPDFLEGVHLKSLDIQVVLTDIRIDYVLENATDHDVIQPLQFSIPEELPCLCKFRWPGDRRRA